MIKVKNQYWSDLKILLDAKTEQFNRPSFIEHDPISIPHQFKKKQDIEIAGLITAVFAWGKRVTIINKTKDFLKRMDNAPHDFLKYHTPQDLKRFRNYIHRTFNETDALYFIEFLSQYYKKNASLETAFAVVPTDEHVGVGLDNFYRLFTSLEGFPDRTKKHISSPEKKSACKRLNMFLRWMVRHDNNGVDFGLWKTISPAQLIIPCDVHVERVGRKLGMVSRSVIDWQMALDLTTDLKRFDPLDPVKYDFALFGLGVVEKY